MQIETDTTKLLPKGKYLYAPHDEIITGFSDLRYGMKQLYKPPKTTTNFGIEGKTVGRQTSYLEYKTSTKTKNVVDAFQYKHQLTTVKRPLTRGEYRLLQAAESVPIYNQPLISIGLTKLAIGSGSKTELSILTKPQLDIKKDTAKIQNVDVLKSYRNIQLGETSQDYISETKQKKDLISSPISTTISKELQKTGVEQKLELASVLEQGQAQKQLLSLSLKYKTPKKEMTIKDMAINNLIGEPRPPEIKIPKPPTILIPGDDDVPTKRKPALIKTTDKGYDVYVKERSMYHGKITKATKFKKVNTNALTKNKALGLGATIADESAAITFKIKPTNEKPTKALVSSKSFKQLEHKFTKNGNTYIEKNKHRLDTPGEQREISLLGRQSRKGSVLSKKNIGLKINKKKKRQKNVRYI